MSCKKRRLIHYHQGEKKFPLKHENDTLDQITISKVNK